MKQMVVKLPSNELDLARLLLEKWGLTRCGQPRSVIDRTLLFEDDAVLNDSLESI
ncbi:MAG: hypothetical protein ACE5IJ_12215 [Thermoplasmata archaeon]